MLTLTSSLVATSKKRSFFAAAIATTHCYIWTFHRLLGVGALSSSLTLPTSFISTTHIPSFNHPGPHSKTLSAYQTKRLPYTTTTIMMNASQGTDGSTPTSTPTATPNEPQIDIESNLKEVQTTIKETATDSQIDPSTIRLVAVSKTKPTPLLQQAYEAGQRHFGENYAQELLTKVEELPKDIYWHFIGPLQSNKAASLVKGVGLDQLTVETVHTMKLATKLNNAAGTLIESGDESLCSKRKQLGIYIQVNTSQEESKSGVSPSEVVSLATEIMESCHHLEILGLMTIGAPGDYSCFDTLVECRTNVIQALSSLDEKKDWALDLSMGMSGDYQEAIRKGSTNVRVGSTIFGARDYSNK